MEKPHCAVAKVLGHPHAALRPVGALLNAAGAPAKVRTSLPGPSTKAAGSTPGKTHKDSLIAPMKPPVKIYSVSQAYHIVSAEEEGGVIHSLKGVDPAFACLIKYCRKISYSARYSDDRYDYRHASLPKKKMARLCTVYAENIAFSSILRRVYSGQLLTEAEWRAIGLRQSEGWENYAHHRPEPHVLLFRRPKKPVDALAKELAKCPIS